MKDEWRYSIEGSRLGDGGLAYVVDRDGSRKRNTDENDHLPLQDPCVVLESELIRISPGVVGEAVANATRRKKVASLAFIAWV